MAIPSPMIITQGMQIRCAAILQAKRWRDNLPSGRNTFQDCDELKIVTLDMAFLFLASCMKKLLVQILLATTKLKTFFVHVPDVFGQNTIKEMCMKCLKHVKIMIDDSLMEVFCMLRVKLCTLRS